MVHEIILYDDRITMAVFAAADGHRAFQVLDGVVYSYIQLH